MKSTIAKLKTALSRILRPQSSNHSPQVEEVIVDFDDGWSWIPKWSEIFHNKMDVWKTHVENAENGPRVLMATCTGGNSTMTPLEALIAVGLTLRGAKVEFLLCDKVLPACPNMITVGTDDQKEFIEKGPNKCDWCFPAGFKTYEDLGLKIHTLSQWYSSEEVTESKRLANSITFDTIADFEDLGVLIGHHAYTGTLRYFGRGDLNSEPNGLIVLKRYLEAGILTNRALHRLFNDRTFSHTVINQGIYVPQGVVVGAAKKFESTVTVFDVAYRKKSIIVDDWSKNFEEGVEHWKELPWNSEMEMEIQKYLNSRRKGTLDWIQVQSADGPDSVSQISKELGIDFNKPTVGLLTNVIWDAQVFYPTNAFKSMIEWLKITIQYFEQRKDIQLLIRVHPGELQGFVKSRQLAVDEINRMFPKLPENVFVIPPESPINTYAAIEKCNAILIYATTAGIELAGVGYPVIVTGEAWVRNKGFTLDASHESEYIKILDSLPLKPDRLEAEKFVLAQKYAYHHYFRRMIPFEMLDPQNSDNVPYTIKPVGIEGFMPGADVGLDVVCDGILKGTNFYYPYESVQKSSASHEFYTLGSPKH